MPIRFDDPEHSPTLRARRTSFDRSQSFVSRKSPSPEGQRRGQSFRAAKSFAGRKPKAEVELAHRPEARPQGRRADAAARDAGLRDARALGRHRRRPQPVRETLAAESCSVVSLSVAYCLEITDAGIRSSRAASRPTARCATSTSPAAAASPTRRSPNSCAPRSSIARRRRCTPAPLRLRLRRRPTAAAAAEAIGGPRQGLAFRALSEGERLQELRVLNLSGCVALSDAGAAILGDALPSALTLEDVSLHGCTQLTDAGGRPLGVGIGGCSSLRSFDLSWCSELADGTALALAEGLAGSQSLRTLKLACCTKLSDVGGDALARALERSNRSLTSLDLSWCPNLGPATVAAFCRSLTRNTTLHTLNTTGCDAMGRRRRAATNGCRRRRAASRARRRRPAAAPERGSLPPSANCSSRLSETASAPASPPPRPKRAPLPRTTPSDRCGTSPQRNSRSCCAPRSPTARGSTTRARATAACASSSAPPERGGGDGSQAIALALQQSNAKSNRPLRERVWALRCAFDALIDELVSQEESTVAKLLNRG